MKVERINIVKLYKTISYRIVSTSIGFILIYFSTGSWKVGAAVSISELVYKPFLYFLHEKIWIRSERNALNGKPGERNSTKSNPAEIQHRA